MNLYETDAFCKEFQASVLTCHSVEQQGKTLFAIELDTTAFYPEGGGQPCDLGWIEAVPVLDVRKKNGKVIHLCSQAIPVGAKVCGKIDWQRRFDLMQQHSGEHILSGFAHSLYGCDNVGFHMGKDFVTIDFNVVLSPEHVQILEDRANQYIWENHPVEISYPQGDDLQQLDYRSKLDLTENVRIVRFPGADTCACCGTHISHSGQVGFVKIFSCQKFRDGVRLELLCGRRGLVYLSQIQQENQSVSGILSAKPLETSTAVQRLQGEKESLAFRLQGMEQEKIGQLAEMYKGSTSVFVQSLSVEGLSGLVTALSPEVQGICACFSQEGKQFRYAIATQQGDVGPLVKALNARFSGRGGGKPNLAQGSITGEQAEIALFLQETQGDL